MTDEELIRRMTETEARSKSNTKRLDRIEADTEKTSAALTRMATAVEVLATEQKHSVEAQKTAAEKIDRLDEKVSVIETAPARSAESLRQKIIEGVVMLVIGALVGAVFALILK